MPRKTNIEKESYWNSPMTRKDWAVLYAASFALGVGISMLTYGPLLVDAIKEAAEDKIDDLQKKLAPVYERFGKKVQVSEDPYDDDEFKVERTHY